MGQQQQQREKTTYLLNLKKQQEEYHNQQKQFKQMKDEEQNINTQLFNLEKKKELMIRQESSMDKSLLLNKQMLNMIIKKNELSKAKNDVEDKQQHRSFILQQSKKMRDKLNIQKKLNELKRNHLLLQSNINILKDKKKQIIIQYNQTRKVKRNNNIVVDTNTTTANNCNNASNPNNTEMETGNKTNTDNTTLKTITTISNETHKPIKTVLQQELQQIPVLKEEKEEKVKNSILKEE